MEMYIPLVLVCVYSASLVNQEGLVSSSSLLCTPYSCSLAVNRISLLVCCDCENVAGTLLVQSLWGSVLLFVNSMFMELLYQFMDGMPTSYNTR